MNKTIIILPIVIVILAAGYFLLVNKSSMVKKDPSTTSGQDEAGFSTPKKAAHWESNTPEHGAVLAGVPVNVVVDFNFDLASGSKMQITSNGTEHGEGQDSIDDNKLALRHSMKSTAPDGIYTATYKACWADGSCHDGQFQFKIDRSLASSFTDMRNKKEVTVELKNIAFNPEKILVTKGTKVTWKNNDSLEHTVNTDSHPAHTYYLGQNSRTLALGDNYSVTFDQAGIYPYHCTPHADSMKGMILVE